MNMVEIKFMNIDENEQMVESLLSEHKKKKTNQSPTNTQTFSFAAHINEHYAGGITGKKIEDEVHISLFAINEQIRGQGVGKKLLDYVKAYAKEQGGDNYDTHNI